MKRTALALALCLGAALPAAAQSVVASDPASLTQVLQSFGYRAELSKDTGGDPKISSAGGGVEFSILFYGCTNGANCDAISFTAGWDLDPGSNNELMNDWNQKQRYTKAYLDDEQDPLLDMDMYLGAGGVSIDNFRFWVDIWERAMGNFKGHINF